MLAYLIDTKMVRMKRLQMRIMYGAIVRQVDRQKETEKTDRQIGSVAGRGLHRMQEDKQTEK